MMEELEPRLLFSADWAGVFAEGDEIAGEPTAIIADITRADVAASTGETGRALLNGDWDLEYQRGDIDTKVAVSAEAQSEWQEVLTTHDPASNRRELVFVDTSVEDYQTLLAGIDSNAEVVLLDANRDGVQQIAEALTGQTGIDAIHIVSHGDQGELHLGTAHLTLDSMLGEHSDELVSIGQALSDQADILVYGCNFGEGDIGAEAASRLAGITGADVAASNDDTGHALLAGDWDFEYQVGTIETHLAFSIEVQQNWVPTFAPPFHSYQAPRSQLPDQAYEITSLQAWGQTFVYDSPGPTYALDRIALILYRATDAPAQTLTVSIRSSWNGAAIASGTISSTRLGAGEGWVDIALDSAAVLNDSATYYIRVDTDGIEKVYAGVDDTGTYANGDLIDKDGLPVTGEDMVFRLRLGNDPLVITNLGGDSLAYTEDDGAVVIEQGGDAMLTDPDSPDFDTGTLTVSFEAGSDSAEDVLAIRDQGTGAGQIGVSGSDLTYEGTVIGSFSGGSGGANLVVTFNGNATPTAATALLKNITYENTDTANSTTGARTVRFVVTDGDGGNSGNHDTTVTVGRQNDASVLAGIEGGDLAYTENDGAVAITSAITLGDVDDTNIESATIQITGNYQNGQDVLAFVDTAGITASWNAATGTLTLTGTEILANYQTALRAVTYENTSDNPSGLIRTVSFTVNDGDDPSNTETRDITPTAVNDAPAITSASTASAPENTTSVLTVTATDADGDTPTFAIVGGADAAAFTINATTGALTFNLAPDFESPADADSNNVYELQVQADDANGGAGQQTINVTVANANEAPVTPTDNANTDLSAPIPPGPSPGQTDTSILFDVAALETPMPDEPSSDAEQPGLLESLPSTGGGFTTNSDANETPPDNSSADSDSADSTAIASTEDPNEAPADPERVSESSRANILERALQSIPVAKSEFTFHDSQAGLRAFWSALDTAREMIENAGTSEAARAKLISRIETGASVALTAGYLTLGFRGNSLLAALLSSLPAWGRFDPMAVLAMSPTDRKKLMKRLEEDDEKIRNVLALEDD